jgi:hypothetical protein
MIQLMQNHASLWREMAQQALSVKYQRKTARISLWIGLSAIAASLIIAIGVPLYQQYHQSQTELSALYRTIDANSDIFVNNYDNMRFFVASDTIANLPDAFVDYTIPDDLDQPLQQKLGMVNYTFLLYYVDETKFLNQIRDQLNTSLITDGAASTQYKNTKQVYIATMNYLELDGWKDTKFNYGIDADCLDYLLQTAFSSIPVSKFDKSVTCSDNSLNRIFYWFGYLPPLTPDWMLPLLKNALNQREAGMGDQLIQPVSQ